MTVEYLLNDPLFLLWLLILRASSTFSSLLSSARRDVLKEVDENVARSSSRAGKKHEAKAAANEVMLHISHPDSIICSLPA